MKASGDLMIARDRVIGHVAMGCKAFLRTVRDMLREIFDESAYDRFLLQTGGSRSSESYRTFMQKKEKETAHRPKCC